MTYTTEQAFDSWAEFDRLWSVTAQGFGDEGFYADAAHKYGRPSVELGVGYGRVAAHTLPDVGIDISSSSLRYCAERVGPAVQLLHDDFCTYRLQEPAALSYAPLGAFNHILDSGTRVQAFANVRANSRSGGLLLFDSYIMSEQRMREMNQVMTALAHDDKAALYRTERVIDWNLWLSENHGVAEYLASDGTVLEKRHFPGPRRCYIPPHQFAIELGRAGWKVEDLWGGYDQRPFKEGCTRQIWLAVNS
ncbi:class I SAM-dependent methyltransferase [Streptomyces sp. NPDC006285]|uniref:class I SAM-dependent methyltransferase n=1 Tax=Streptomyces sp. NPDC006285 TaxID=3364742 RepID=UPI0036B12E06